MGNLSEHFNKKDFACKCDHCKGKFKISLGVVGALEFVQGHFKKRVTVVHGYKCPDLVEQESKIGKSYHNLGKAADFRVDGVPLEEIYKFVKQMPEVTGLGMYPKEKFIHIDLREKERHEWVYENNKYVTLTSELAKKYNLE